MKSLPARTAAMRIEFQFQTTLPCPVVEITPPIKKHSYLNLLD
jgi:hypothetical protein